LSTVERRVATRSWVVLSCAVSNSILSLAPPKHRRLLMTDSRQLDRESFQRLTILFRNIDLYVLVLAYVGDTNASAEGIKYGIIRSINRGCQT